jgi:hypothetical protein
LINKIKFFLLKFKWNELIHQFTNEMNTINKSLKDARMQASQLIYEIESEIKVSESLFVSILKDENNNKQNLMEEEFVESDGLVIHEDEDLDGDGFSSPFNHSQANKNQTIMEKKYRDIENLTNKPLEIDAIQSEFRVGYFFKNFIQSMSLDFLKGILFV